MLTALLLAAALGTQTVTTLEALYRKQPTNANVAHDLAVAYLEAGQLAKARTHLQTLLAADDKAEWHNLLAEALERSGETVAAGQEYRRAAEMDPNEKNLFDWANQFLAHQLYDQALTGFRYAVEKHPRSAKLRVGLGIAFYSLRQYDEAVEALCAAVDLDPADVRPLTFLGKMNDISPAMAGAARKRLAGFAKRYPTNAAANYYYAVSLRQRWNETGAADWGEVESLLKKAAIADPQMAEAHLQLGILYEDTKRVEEAIRSYERAIAVRPGLEQAHYRLGRLYLQQGKTDLANRHLAEYRRLHAEAKK